MASGTESTGMLTREQLFHLFDRFIFLTSQPDVKKRIAGAVQDKQEAVAVTTAIQEEIFLEMGIDPRFGISCLGKVSTVYENDLDLVIQFYKFLSKSSAISPLSDHPTHELVVSALEMCVGDRTSTRD